MKAVPNKSANGKWAYTAHLHRHRPLAASKENQINMDKQIEIKFKRLNHIQICIPKKKEEEARNFYCNFLGLEEIEKPEYLRKNGGFWLRIADIELHIGAENLENKSKRHPAFEVEKLERIKQELNKHLSLIHI